jgi:hypothetical protein
VALRWHKTLSSTRLRAWSATHDHVRYTITATRYRSAFAGGRSFYNWEWIIRAHEVGGASVELKRAGFVTYSGFRRLAKMVADHVSGVEILEHSTLFEIAPTPPPER